MYINQQSFIYTRSQKNQQDTDLYLQIDKIINTSSYCSMLQLDN
jgi:hypothetical protein